MSFDTFDRMPPVGLSSSKGLSTASTVLLVTSGILAVTGVASFIAMRFWARPVPSRPASRWRQILGLSPSSDGLSKPLMQQGVGIGEPKQHHGPSHVVAPDDVTEPTSQSNFPQVATTHLSFDVNIDFARKSVSGTVSFTLHKRDKDVEELVLDTRDLIIHECYCKSAQIEPYSKAEHSLQDPPNPIFGAALRIQLDKGTTPTHVKVKFETTTASSALQWLTPAQTAGKRHPYLFTQSQAIHARSFFPCQDAPGVKATYDAKVTVPAPLVALMSAVSTGSAKTHQGLTTYHFKQKVPVPSYLIALAVGDLESRELGPRSRVWSEPSMVELAHYEFADTEKFLTTAEQIAGDYVWGRYDLLLLPPSFPYGGMENPCLVFLTPTLLAGDRSLVNVVAHEIAHSWFGNLVTNATWEDFWMNEGFTVFTERRIIAKLFGDSRAGLKRELGIRDLKEDIDRYGKDHPFTKLHVDMRSKPVDPDDSFSSVPYEKGCAFLEHIERLVGGPKVFEPFLKEYVARFRYGFVDVPSFKTIVKEKFPNIKIDWNKWVYATGMPPDLGPPQENVLVALAEKVANKWIETGKRPAEADGANTSWSSDQLCVMLQRFLELQEKHALADDLVNDVDTFFAFSDSRNSEIRFKWDTVGLKMRNPTQACYDDTVEFLGEQGRMKYVRPLYRDLFKANKNLALETFKKNRDNYHSIAQKMIAKDLGLDAVSSNKSGAPCGNCA